MLARRLKGQWRVSPALERWLTLVPFVLLGFVFISVILGWSVDLNALEPFDAYVIRFAESGTKADDIPPLLYPFEGYLSAVVWIGGWASIAIAVGGLIASLFQPLAYCKYGCLTGALFKLLRCAGDRDKRRLRASRAATALLLAAFSARL